jgi:hypothetical protein
MAGGAGWVKQSPNTNGNMSSRCLARLTNWEKSYGQLGPCARASMVRICKKKPVDGEVLCEECKRRPEGGKYQTRMFHGLLTDPPCADSAVYGSDYYWMRLEKLGPRAAVPPEWLEAAEAAQAEAEEWCRGAGHEPWKVQRPADKDLEEMKRAKKTAKAAAPNAGPAGPAAQVKGTLLKAFAPIKVLYEESDKAPEKLPVDSMPIKRVELDAGPVWQTENGLVFDCDTTGEPGELLGRMVDGVLEEV